MHGLVVLDLIFQHVVKLFLGQVPVTAVQGVNDIEADITVRGNEERLVHIVIRRGLGQFKGQHLDGDRNGSDGCTISHHRNSALVKTGSLSFFRVNGEEKLLERALVQSHGLERGGILEIGLHALEGNKAAVRGVTITMVHFPGRSQPEIGLGTVFFREAGIVGDFFRIDFDQIFIVQKKFRDQFQFGVGEVAPPAVFVLIPDLDDLEIQLIGGEDHALFVLERSQFEFNLAQFFQRIDQEGAGFVFILRSNDPDRRNCFTVEGIRLRETHEFAHGRDGIVRNFPLEVGIFVEVGCHTGRRDQCHLIHFFGIQRVQIVFQVRIFRRFFLNGQLLETIPVHCIGNLFHLS